MIGDLLLLERENEKLRQEVARLNAMLDKVEAMGCAHKGNLSGCPGCFVAIERAGSHALGDTASSCHDSQVLSDVISALEAPTHAANDYNCEDWPPGTGCSGCKGDELRKAARVKLREISRQDSGAK